MKTVQTVYGVFDTDLGRLVGIAPQGVSDVTFLAGQDTQTVGDPVTALVNPVTGRIEKLTFSGKQVRMMRRSGNVGTRILSCRSGAFDNSTPKTFRAIVEVAAGFDAVRPIFANGATGTGYTVAACNVRSLANLDDSLPSAVSVSLPSGGVVPNAITSVRRSYMLGDWTDLNSVTRTDGGKGALVCIDAYVSTASSISILGNGTNDNFANWSSRTNRKWVMLHNDGDCVTTPGNFVSTTSRIQSPIVGVQYAARGRVITVMGVGDSITDGRGTYIGEGFGVPACEAVSADGKTVFEWANLGGSGVDAVNFRKYLGDAIYYGIIPDIAVMPSGTPNSSGTPISELNIKSMRSALSEMLRVCRDNSILPVVWTWMPTNSSVKDYNSSDSLRSAYNDGLLSGYPEIDKIDFALAMSGAVDGDGQVNMLAGATTDGIHPNDIGNALLWPLLADYLKSVF